MFCNCFAHVDPELLIFGARSQIHCVLQKARRVARLGHARRAKPSIEKHAKYKGFRSVVQLQRAFERRVQDTESVSNKKFATALSQRILALLAEHLLR
jgi:hypothetical protein